MSIDFASFQNTILPFALLSQTITVDISLYLQFAIVNVLNVRLYLDCFD